MSADCVFGQGDLYIPTVGSTRVIKIKALLPFILELYCIVGIVECTIASCTVHANYRQITNSKVF